MQYVNIAQPQCAFMNNVKLMTGISWINMDFFFLATIIKHWSIRLETNIALCVEIFYTVDDHQQANWIVIKWVGEAVHSSLKNQHVTWSQTEQPFLLDRTKTH